VLADTAWLAAQVGLAPRDRAVVALAACAHDIVDDARPGDDERASAAWAAAALTAASVAAAEVERVRALVLATLTHHAEPDDLAAAVLLDADLAILAAAPAEYAEYVARVRAEYAEVPDDAWRTGRAGVLESLVSRADLFVTEPARRRWDAAARRNVAAELDGLRPRADQSPR
jgi:predicted metal-dependent HD superfamily phosphohydrolase